jgi:outer membrane protein OmpA-like peptidoglycan-associated protein
MAFRFCFEIWLNALGLAPKNSRNVGGMIPMTKQGRGLSSSGPKLWFACSLLWGVGCKSTTNTPAEDQIPLQVEEEIAAELAQEGYAAASDELVDYSISDYKAFDPSGIAIPFGFNESKLLPQTVRSLEKIVKGMKKDPLSRIMVQGHSDKQGPRSHNYRLSQQRAQVITQYLIQQGIEEYRIEQAAYGESLPVEEGNTVRVFKKNRRGDFQMSYGRNVFGKD